MGPKEEKSYELNLSYCGPESWAKAYLFAVHNSMLDETQIQPT